MQPKVWKLGVEGHPHGYGYLAGDNITCRSLRMVEETAVPLEAKLLNIYKANSNIPDAGPLAQ